MPNLASTERHVLNTPKPDTDIKIWPTDKGNATLNIDPVEDYDQIITLIDKIKLRSHIKNWKKHVRFTIEISSCSFILFKIYVIRKVV